MLPRQGCIPTSIPYRVLSLVLKDGQLSGARQQPAMHPFSPILEATLQAKHGKQNIPKRPAKHRPTLTSLQKR